MPTVVNAGALGAQGFTIIGPPGNYAGWSVSDAGDINGDGLDDVIIGTRGGAAYVLFGQGGGPGNIDLTNLSPSDGFRIYGEGGDFTGLNVSAAGDVNGDGFDDFIVGGFTYDFYYGSNPTAYMIFGKGAGFATINVSELAASDGFRIIGGFGFYSYGVLAVSSAGDVNGDGFDDIIVGSTSDNNDAGAAYVIFGKASGFGPVDLANLSQSTGFEIAGAPGSSDFLGRSVSGAGDVNGDGFDDLIVGARYGNKGGTDAGEAYVIFGKASAFTTIDLSNLAPGSGFIIQGDDPGDGAGWSVSAAGDINGDGFDDVIVGGALAASSHPFAGEAHVIFGKAGGFTTIDLSNLAAGAGFVIIGDDIADNAGWSVSGAGDVNNDGFADILIGAPRNNQTRNGVSITDGGEAYVIFGKATGFTTIDLTNLSSADGFIIQGEGAFDFAGYSVSAAGDVDGDGFDDLLVGAPYAGLDSGAAYLISGKLHFHGSDFNQARAGDFNGDGRDDILWRNDNGAVTNWLGQANGSFVANGSASHSAGNTGQIVGTGDFNGDGRDDILWRNDNGNVTNWLGQANGSFVANGNANHNAGTGWYIAGIGDFNGDGRDDILWRKDNGAVTDWLGQANGSFVGNGGNANHSAGTGWHIAGTGDFNGDNRDDILWRHDNGAVTNWLGQANGSFVGNGGNAYYQVDNSWTVQPSFGSGVGDWAY